MWDDMSDVKKTMDFLRYKLQKLRENLYNKKKLAV